MALNKHIPSKQELINKVIKFKAVIKRIKSDRYNAKTCGSLIKSPSTNINLMLLGNII